MRRLAVIAFAAFILAGLALSPAAKAYFSVPAAPSGFVNDFAGVLSAPEKSALESKLTAFNASTTIEIAVVTVKNLGGDTIEAAARAIFDSWKIGKTKKDNGVLLLVSVEDRKIRIEPGYGLEGALTDLQSSGIIQNDIAPFLKDGRYYDGLNAGTDGIVAAVSGEAGTPLPLNSSSGSGWNFNSSSIWFFGILFFGIIRGLAVLLGRTKSWWLGGVLGGALGGGIGLFTGGLVAGVIGITVMGVIGLLFVLIVSHSYDKWKSGGGQGPWLGGGRFGGGGGGGFGGFGGGRSGGGGASGGF